jgi:hypothetical protein
MTCRVSRRQTVPLACTCDTRALQASSLQPFAQIIILPCHPLHLPLSRRVWPSNTRPINDKHSQLHTAV